MDTSSSVTWLTRLPGSASTAAKAAVTWRDVGVELQVELVTDAVDHHALALQILDDGDEVGAFAGQLGVVVVDHQLHVGGGAADRLARLEGES